MKFEIFKVGNHTSDKGVSKEYTLDDLNFIASSYNPEESEAPLVIGHPENNSPAYGWISSLEVTPEGILIANAPDEKINSDFLKVVNEGRYKKRSISLTPEGKLRHVGFLGGAAPSVKGLKDIQFSQPSSSVYVFDYINEGEDLTNETNDKVVTPVPASHQSQSLTDLSSLSSKVDDLKESLDNISKNFTESDDTKSQLSEIHNQVNSIQSKITQNELENLLSDKVSAGTLTPAIKNKLLDISNFVQSQNFSEDFSSPAFVNGINNHIKELVKSFPKIIYYENFAEKPDAIDTKDEDLSDFEIDPESKSLHSKALSLMKKDEISYLSALKKLTFN